MMQNNILGITGEAGSGKSLALSIMEREFSAYLIIADRIPHKLYSKGEDVYYKVVENFGKEILTEEGEIDRNVLSAIVYNDKERLDLLNSIVHPEVKKEILGSIKLLREEEPEKLVVIEAALLLEGGYKEICDEIWYIKTDEHIRRERLKTKRGYSDEKIDNIINNQLKTREFEAMCDRTVLNNGSLKELKDNLIKAYGIYQRRGEGWNSAQ